MRPGDAFAWARAALCALLAIAAGPAAQAAEPRGEAFAALDAQKDELFAAMAAQAAFCLARRDTDHAVFNGCIDWHSSVHATWALLAYRRATGDARYDQLLAQTLAPEGLAQEWELLRRRPRFETPYGRAWFLRLALEHRALGGAPDLRPMADDVANGLLRVFGRLEGRRRGVSPQIGSYDSHAWALSNLLDYLRASDRREEAARVEGWIRAGFVETDLRCPEPLTLQSFMAICANWAAAAMRVLSRDEARAWADRFFEVNPPPQPLRRPRRAHNFGLNFSRAWAYWDVYAATGEARYRRLYAEHMLAGAPKRNWAGDYRANGHWVAQFGMYALQPLVGDRAEAALEAK